MSACNEEGDGEGGKSNGNDNKEGNGDGGKSDGDATATKYGNGDGAKEGEDKSGKRGNNGDEEGEGEGGKRGQLGWWATKRAMARVARVMATATKREMATDSNNNQKRYYAPFMGYKFIAYLCP